MKKTALLMVAVLLLPSLAGANGWGSDWRKNTDRKVLQKVDWAMLRAQAKQAKEQQAAEEAKKIAAQFEALKQQFPREAKLISGIALDHDDVVKAAGKNYSREGLTHALEYLYEDFVALEKVNKTAASAVKKVLNHTYRMAILGGARKNLRDVKDELILDCGGQTVINGKVYGLQIKGSEWFDTFDAKSK